MKTYHLMIVALLILAALGATTVGCKYDVAEPKWDSPPASSTEGSITSIVPSQATPGVNTITILGTNLSGALDTNRIIKHYNYTDSSGVARDTIVYDSTWVYGGVYFGNVRATVLEISSTMIKVHRPNVVSNSCTIKIASDNALVTMQYSPYRIDAVMESFGAFVENVPLGAITVDRSGNFYVTDSTNGYLYTLTPAGGRTQVRVNDSTNLVLKYAASDARIGPDGNLYYFTGKSPNTKYIQMVILNPSSVMDSTWYTFSPVKNVICGDFDQNGYLYAAGRRSGIQVIRPNQSRRDDGGYTNDTITAVRVFDHYLYVAVRSGVYRHPLTDTSLIGAQQLVLDLSQGLLAGRVIKALSFSADGSKMYFGTNTDYPIVMADASTMPITIDKLEPLYKDILPGNCKNFCFENYLYSILGNAVYKIDVGTTGAPYYH
jgi:hypothetical protein